MRGCTGGWASVSGGGLLAAAGELGRWGRAARWMLGPGRAPALSSAGLALVVGAGLEVVAVSVGVAAAFAEACCAGRNDRDLPAAERRIKPRTTMVTIHNYKIAIEDCSHPASTCFCSDFEPRSNILTQSEHMRNRAKVHLHVNCTMILSLPFTLSLLFHWHVGKRVDVNA